MSEIEQLEDGVYADIPFSQYLAIDRISKHGLDSLARTPAHYRYQRAHPSEPSEAMALGSAFHTLTLEPEKFDSEFIVTPDGINRRTKAGKEAWVFFLIEAQGKQILTADQRGRAQAMADSVRRHPLLQALLADGNKEQTVLWTDPDTGVPCKCRPDWLCDRLPIIADLKSARDASPEVFARDAARYRYHVQEAMYMSGLSVAGRPKDTWIYIVCESDPPHFVALYQSGAAERQLGYRWFREDLVRYADCRFTDQWPAYPVEVQTLEYPAWAFSRPQK